MYLILEYVNQIIDKDNFPETDTGEREKNKWFLLTGNSMAMMCLNNPMLVKLTSTMLKTRHFTTEQIGDMPHWIEEGKNAVIRKQMQHQCQ